MVMKDPWYGHRDYFFEPDGDKGEWVAWDYSLASALQIIEDGTDKSSGLPHWMIDAEEADVIAVRRTDKFQAAIAKKTKGTEKRPYKAQPGETWVPEVSHSYGGDQELPTYREYLAKLREVPEELEV